MKKILLGLSLTVFGLSFTTAQTINTVAGNYALGAGYSGDGGPATAAELWGGYYVAFDASGNYYIADQTNNVIRKVNTSGIISTFAGNGIGGYSGDGGQATAAEFTAPFGIAFDANGNMYIGDTYNNRVRKINTSGIISTFAGNGINGFTGDGGQATAAEIFNPMDVTFDANGNLYIADQTNNVVRKVNTSGVISTYAGNGAAGFSGDGGQAYLAEMTAPTAMAVDGAGNLYISDQQNYVIRMVDLSQNIHTIAGKHGFQGYSGDGGPATAAELWNPFGLAFDTHGNLFVSDGNSAVRMINTSGTISTFAGNMNGGYSGDGGPATAADLSNPTGVAFDGGGNLYIADGGNYVIREVTGIPTGIAQSETKSDAVSIFPNPSNGIFNLSIRNYQLGITNYTLQVYNMLGEKVYYTQFSNQNTKIDISNQAPGIYLYRVISETGTSMANGRLIIQ